MLAIGVTGSMGQCVVLELVAGGPERCRWVSSRAVDSWPETSAPCKSLRRTSVRVPTIGALSGFIEFFISIYTIRYEMLQTMFKTMLKNHGR